jgi:hypothetical protein
MLELLYASTLRLQSLYAHQTTVVYDLLGKRVPTQD